MAVVLWLAVAGAGPAGAESDADAESGDSAAADVFAIVGEEQVDQAYFDSVLRTLARERFFHGEVPQTEWDAFYREVRQTVIDRALLLQEAERRGYKPREQRIADRIALVDERNRHMADWHRDRGALIGRLRAELEENDLLEQLESRIKDVPRPSATEARQYYDNNREKFTIPAQTRVAVILLTVEPWAPGARWQEAADTAGELVARLRDGEDFAVLARRYSGHESAERGGDLGMVHSGMLTGEVQEVVDNMKPGEISEPVRLLQGIAVFRRGETVPPVLNDFEKVRQRAGDLLQSEREGQAWQTFIQQLRDRTVVKVIGKPADNRSGDPGMGR